jgi:hypothetical protein
MQQLELFDSAVVFAIHHDKDKLKELRKTNKEAALKVLVVRELINRMAAAYKYEDYRYINHVNNTLNKFLAN